MLPILFQSHDLILYSYPLLMGIGWGIGYQIFFANYPKDSKKYESLILFWGIFLFSWVGAKVMFLLTSNSSGANQWSFWTGGGFVFYGGLIGSIIYLAILKIIGISLTLNKLWAILPALVFGHATGRLGCFLAGCCFGDPTTWFWGVNIHGEHRHPTQLLEVIGLLLLGWLILKLKENKVFTLSLYFVGYGLIRFLIEFLRGDEIRGEWGALTPSQWISLGMIITGGIIINKFNKLSKWQ